MRHLPFSLHGGEHAFDRFLTEYLLCFDFFLLSSSRSRQSASMLLRSMQLIETTLRLEVSGLSKTELTR